MDAPREVPARRGFSISYGGKTLLSRIDPVAQAERLAAEIPLKERTLYFCPSPLYGYGLSLFLERLNEPQARNSALLCVEADEKLFGISRNAMEKLGAESRNRDPQPLALVMVSDPEGLCAFVRKTWGERRFRRVEVIHFTGGWQLFPRLYEDLALTLRREIALEWGNAMTLIRLGRLYTRNFIRNIYFLSESNKITAQRYGPSPIVVLGAGPSLDSFLDEMALLSGGKIPEPCNRAYKIICVDTCLPVMHERGILPDLVVILESQHWNLRDFSGERGRNVDAAIDLSALPASGRVLGGKRFWFFTPWTELALFRRLEEAGLLGEPFPPLGSVGLSATAIAMSIGSGPVLLSGIDFSFTLDAYHARSTPGHSEMAGRQNRFRSIINAGAVLREGTFPTLSGAGERVRSDPAMRNYRDLFEQEFGGNPRLASIAGSGLPLGIKTITPAEAFAILNNAGAPARPLAREVSSTAMTDAAAQIRRFISREMDTLDTLKRILTGETPADAARLEELLDAADYLWAHFPDCAGGQGTARRPPGTDIGFLKRVRAEIEPFRECWEQAVSNYPS